MTPLALLCMLRDLGVHLIPLPDGEHIRVDAPAGVVTDALRQSLGEHKEALLTLLEAFEERAGIAEYCGGLSHEDAERLAWQCLMQEEPHAPNERSDDAPCICPQTV